MVAWLLPIAKYSGTPLFWTSEMRTSHFNGHFAPVRVPFPLINNLQYNPWNADTPLFRNAYKFIGPFSTWTVHNSLENALTRLPLTQVCLPRLINSTTGFIIVLVRIVLASGHAAFPTSVQQGRALERNFVALNSMGCICHTYRKYTGSLRNTYTSIIRTCSSSLMVPAIEGFHCVAGFSLGLFQRALGPLERPKTNNVPFGSTSKPTYCLGSEYSDN